MLISLQQWWWWGGGYTEWCRWSSFHIWYDVYIQVFQEPTLNAFMALGRPAWTEARQVLQQILSKDEVRGEHLN